MNAKLSITRSKTWGNLKRAEQIGFGGIYGRPGTCHVRLSPYTSYRPVKHTHTGLSLLSSHSRREKLVDVVREKIYKELSRSCVSLHRPFAAAGGTFSSFRSAGAPLFISYYIAHLLLMGSWLLPVLVRVEILPQLLTHQRGGCHHPPARRRNVNSHWTVCV
jgi:hypothetical protein